MSTDSEGDPLAERVWTYVCPFRRYLLVVAILEIVFLVLLVFSLAVGVEPGTSTYYILQIDLLIVVPTLAAFTYAYYRCRNREQI
mgnify:CR=1 FL=1